MAAVMGPVLTWLARPWHAHMRAIDLHVLWPVCAREADARSLDLDCAKAAFAQHCFHDPAWLALGDEEIIRRIDALEHPVRRGCQTGQAPVALNPARAPDRCDVEGV
jgi:hypothetical protein